MTEDQVLRLLAEHKSGVPQTELATKYGLHYVYVNKIVKGHKWAHLPR